MKIKDAKEWMLQAEYDLHAAEKNFEAGLNPYSIFMCHLAIEKALKSIYVLKFKKEPPKYHDLIALVKIANLDATEDMESFIRDFSAISVRARYPEDLKIALKEYDNKKTMTVLADTKKVLKWLKRKLNQK